MPINQIPGITNRVNSDTTQRMQEAAGLVGVNNAFAQEAIKVALYNMEEQLRSTSWAKGLMTEKDLLGQGVALAKA